MRLTGKNKSLLQDIKKNRWEAVKKLNKERKKTIVLDILELQGSYALDNASYLFDILSVGTRLILCEDEKAPSKDMLSAETEKGHIAGFLPAGISLFIRYLLKREIEVFCYVEQTDFTNEMLTIIASLCLEDY